MTAIEQSRAYGAPGSKDQPGCADWRQHYVFDRFPNYAEQLAAGFLAIAQRDGNAAGNRWLRRIQSQLYVGPFNVTHDDNAIVEHAKAQARAVADAHSRLSGSAHRAGGTEADAITEALRLGLERVERHEIDPPSNKSPQSAQLARLVCDRWWRRKLRVLAGRRIEQLEREIGNVHRRAGIYCSTTTVHRRRSQKARNHALLEAVEAINQHDQHYTLAELSELGLANPEHRRAELMLRIRDTEAEAIRIGHAGLFYTLTCPSRFHPVRARSCTRNPVYDGYSPREAQRYLTNVWARIRAQLARDGVGVYGVRVAEPHHDGTPHWHLLLWADPEHVEYINGVMRDYALQDSPDEPGAERNRLKIVEIDPKKGSAAGYVAKYVAKNINGEQFVESDSYGRDMTESAPRIEAWAAVWGIRQFQFVGLPSVTVWREVRRITEQQAEQIAAWEEATNPGRRIKEFLAKVRTACNAGAWDQFLRLMGGPLTPRKDQPIKPWRLDRMVDPGTDTVSRTTGEDSAFARGRYGERVQVTYGLLVKSAEYLTRFYSWTIRPKSRNSAYDFSQRSYGGVSGGGEAADPWTRVNNCTGIDITPRQPDPQTAEQQEKHYQDWRSRPEVRAEIEAEQEEIDRVRDALARLLAPPPSEPDPAPDQWASAPEYMPEELR